MGTVVMGVYVVPIVDILARQKWSLRLSKATTRSTCATSVEQPIKLIQHINVA